MNIAEISKYKKYVERGLYENTQVEKLSDRYSHQEQQSISHLDILFSSTRAESVVKNGISYKCVVDYGKSSKPIGDSSSSITREIWTKHGDGIKTGDVLQYTPSANVAIDTYLLVNTKETRDGYDLGTIKRCISSLKWLDSFGAIKEAPFAISSDVRTLGLNEDKVMTLPSERRSIVIQQNSDTSKIRKSQRFIFDGERSWRVTGINTLITNLITLELEEVPISKTDDNVVLRIADYFIHEYSIHISNGNQINLSIGDTLQLNVVAKDIGTIEDLPVTYTSTDESILTVSESGLITAIANGDASVHASLTNSPSTSDTLSVSVSDVVQSGWTLDIQGNDYCSVNQTQTFRGEVKNNGVTDVSKLIRWTLYDDSGTQPTTLGVIISQSGHDVKIRANSKYTGHVKIKGVCYEESNLTVEDLTIYSVEELAMETIDELFSLGLTVDQLVSYTVKDLADRTVGELENEVVLVSSEMRIEIRSLL